MDRRARNGGLKTNAENQTDNIGEYVIRMRNDSRTVSIRRNEVMDNNAYRNDSLYYSLDGMGRNHGNKAESEQTREKGKRGKCSMIIYNEAVGRNKNGEVIYEEKINNVFEPREIAETLYDAVLDMDFADYGEEKEDNLKKLTEQIEGINNADFEALYTLLECLTDRFYDYIGGNENAGMETESY